MVEEVCLPLGRNPGADPGEEPSAQPDNRTLEENNYKKTQPKYCKERAVRRDQDLIDNSLKEKWRDKDKALYRQAEQENLEEGTFYSYNATGNGANGDGSMILNRFEVSSRVQFQGDSGKMFTGRRQGHSDQTARGIVEHNLSSRGLLQDYEVVHVPVQNARDLQFRKILELDPEWPWIESQPVGHIDQGSQRGSLD